MSYLYVEDTDGRRVYVGDYVKCVVGHYAGVKKGERRRVQAIVDGWKITLNNHMSPTGTSDYPPHYFALAERYIPNLNSKPKAQQEKTMLHIAVRVTGEPDDLAILASNINRKVEHSIDMLADVSQSALKEKLRARIIAEPSEKWLILSGNTIAETSAPPVRFRSI